MFYTDIGTICGIAGSLCGLFIIYATPICVHWKREYLLVKYPKIVKGIEGNKIRTVQGLSEREKIELHNEFDADNSEDDDMGFFVDGEISSKSFDREEPLLEGKKRGDKSVKMVQFWYTLASHSSLILFGIGILILQFVKI